MKQTLVLENFPSTEMARALSPNGRAHWATKRKFTEAVHVFVKVRALIQHLQPMIGYVVMQPTFIYPVARKRDDDNLGTGVLKACRDGLVEAGLLVADDMEHLEQKRPIVEVQKRRRALILEFTMQRAPLTAADYDRVFRSEEEWDTAGDIKPKGGLVQGSVARGRTRP